MRNEVLPIFCHLYEGRLTILIVYKWPLEVLILVGKWHPFLLKRVSTTINLKPKNQFQQVHLTGAQS